MLPAPSLMAPQVQPFPGVTRLTSDTLARAASRRFDPNPGHLPSQLEVLAPVPLDIEIPEERNHEGRKTGTDPKHKFSVTLTPDTFERLDSFCKKERHPRTSFIRGGPSEGRWPTRERSAPGPTHQGQEVHRVQAGPSACSPRKPHGRSALSIQTGKKRSP